MPIAIRGLLGGTETGAWLGTACWLRSTLVKGLVVVRIRVFRGAVLSFEFELIFSVGRYCSSSCSRYSLYRYGSAGAFFFVSEKVKDRWSLGFFNDFFFDFLIAH